jgi:hypothetical protein
MDVPWMSLKTVAFGSPTSSSVSLSDIVSRLLVFCRIISRTVLLVRLYGRYYVWVMVE